MTKDVLQEAKRRMEKVSEDLRSEMATLRTGRASITLLDHTTVDYFGTPTPINQLATLSVPEPTTILVQAWDPTTLPQIEKAILSSDLGLNPANDGKVLRVPIPPLTEERRKELVKHLHKVLESHRTAVRNLRRDANDTVKKLLKDKKISEDEERHAHTEAQKITDQAIAKLDEMGKNKEKEILMV